MKVKIDLTYNLFTLFYDNGTPKSQHLMQWLSVHNGILEVDIPTIPLPDECLDIITENKNILSCRIKKRCFTIGINPSQNEIQATVCAEIISPEKFQNGLNDDTNNIKTEQEKNETIEDILQSNIINYLKTHESGAIPTRLINILQSWNIRTFADVCQYRRNEVSKWRHLGRQSIDFLDDILGRNGLRFGMDVTKYGIQPTPKI